MKKNQKENKKKRERKKEKDVSNNFIVLFEELAIPDKDRSFQEQRVRTFWKVKPWYLDI